MSDEQGGNAMQSDASTGSDAPADVDQSSTSPTNQVDDWPSARLVHHVFQDEIHISDINIPRDQGER